MTAVNPQMQALQTQSIAEKKQASDAALSDLRKALRALERLDFTRAVTFTGANFCFGVIKQMKREGKNSDAEINISTGFRNITIHAADAS